MGEGALRDAFDVFFSYHTVDHAAVTQVARRLHERGIRVFLDRWYLAAGQPWPQALEQTLPSCGAVAVFIGERLYGLYLLNGFPKVTPKINQ